MVCDHTFMSEDEKDFIHRLWVDNYSFMKGKIITYRIPPSAEEDIISNCFLGFIRNKKRLLSMLPEEIKAYIAVSLRNECLHWLQSEAKKQTLIYDESQLHFCEDTFAEEERLLAEIDAKDQVRRLAEELDERDKLMLLGTYVEGMTSSEIAQRIGCKEDSVRSLLSRARKRARELLANEKEGGDHI